MSERKLVEELIEQEDDFDRWYIEVVHKAELVDESPVRGTRVIRPYGFAIWELMQAELDRRIKETGVQNAYFPLFIPKSMLEREAEHIEGFAPEVAWVTRGGDKELEEPWAVRPTSESIICPMFARWVQSYRDLPILINQWCSVVRWEERPRAYLRTLEFLWQEGHTVHATLEEAEERARLMLEVYRDFVETELAIPVIPGQKTESEKFAGALRTYTIEAMMGGKHWALQSATSHNLGDHFGRVFDIQYLDAQGQRRYAFNTSWGLSHRTVGAMVMVHGDDRGLKLPPRVAPIQVIIVPIWRSEEERAKVEALVDTVRARLLEHVRVYADLRDDKTPGWKFNEWDLKGVPIRLEIGPRDVAQDQVTLVRRDILGERITVPVSQVVEAVLEELNALQQRLYDAAKAMLERYTEDVEQYEQLKERVASNAGFNRAFWCGSAECEARVKAETKATIRCIPFVQPETLGPCIVCGMPGKHQVIWARAY
ncbi:proline--tRNA ligase [Thermorudis peleae]|uniref:proline--tRNA ligase n=1 Tax=Thermorudis peleae TaxID=1382356 RepID=UPI00056FD2A2|nr:proline--tRNA ligase [Thermorudis peleae]MBX6754284.1 proline--tRNA ligase [Thermorudis peleae]